MIQCEKTVLKGQASGIKARKNLPPTDLQQFVLILFAVFFFVGSFVIVQLSGGMWVDEYVHYDQVLRFVESNYQLNPELTTPPFFHFLLAIPGRLVSRFSSITFVRLFCFLLGLSCIFVFYIVCRRAKVDQALMRSLQFAFMPILFPFFFLIYTDVLSIELLLLSFCFAFNRKSVAAGVFAILSMIIRQTNIVWLIFTAVFVYLKEREEYRNQLSYLWTFFLGGFLFVGFYLLNHGVPIGDRPAHPLGISFGNLYLCLFLAFFLFIPTQLRQLSTAFKKRSALFWIILFAVSYLIYSRTFKVDHFYNQAPEYFLRNKLMLFFSATELRKIIFFVPIGISLITLTCVRLYSPSFRVLLYVATLLFLLPQVLIEPRYSLIPLTFFLIFRPSLPPQIERITLVGYMIGSIILLWGMLSQTYFL